MNAVSIRDLRFAYPSARSSDGFALSLPSWDVPRGARVALHGPSGCGKSTLLAVIAGALPAAASRLEVQGPDLTTLSESARRAHRIRHVGFVFQDYPLVDYLDATDNVLFPYRLNPALTLDAAARDRAAALLAELGLAGKERRAPRRLSQGERQRVAIARALVTEPSILLADEPTAGLDPARSAAVLELLEGLCESRELTLLLVTHDPAILSRFDAQLDVGPLGGDS